MRLRGWWLWPRRPAPHRLISPWEYRRLRAFAISRLAGGCIAAAAGIVCLPYGGYGWATFFLAIGALNVWGGYWFLTIARSLSVRR
jgi:hypothetical protein